MSPVKQGAREWQEHGEKRKKQFSNIEMKERERMKNGLRDSSDKDKCCRKNDNLLN